MMVDTRPVASFGRAAEAYERGRPGYPADAVAWLAEKLDLGLGRTVLDLGAGTGKLSQRLVETGARVVAVEPVEKMRRLLETVAGVEALAGRSRGDSTSRRVGRRLHDRASLPLVEPVAALAEIHRVLRPGSALALLWNRPDEADPLTAAFTAVLARYRAHPPVGYTWPEGYDRAALFTPTELRTFANM